MAALTGVTIRGEKGTTYASYDEDGNFSGNIYRQTDWESFQEHKEKYIREKAELETRIELAQLAVDEEQMNLYAVERKRKSKHKETYIQEQQRKLDGATSVWYAWNRELFGLEMCNMQRVTKIRESDEVDVVEVPSDDPYRNSYIIRKKEIKS